MALPSAHSPLGASGAERWIACPGSVSLSQGIVDEESDYAALGTAAHSLAAHCLTVECDAWEVIGTTIYQLPDGGTGFVPAIREKEPLPKDWKVEAGAGIKVDKDMADAVQVYLDYVRSFPSRNQGNFFVERAFHCPTIHPLFYGTSDNCYLQQGTTEKGSGLQTLYVTDYKHGAGIVVDAEDNVQMKYYACGMLEDLGLWDSVDKVVCTIVQPRGWQEPVRSWETTTQALLAWMEDELVPAMNRAQVSTDTESGEHCRFCPARGHNCPQLMADLDELEVHMTAVAAKGAGPLDPGTIARILKLMAGFKIQHKAVEDEAFKRLNVGVKVPGFKLGEKKANREFRDEMIVGKKPVKLKEAMEAEFGKKAYTEPELLSPAQTDKLPGGKDFTARWAFKPNAGLCVVPADDSRPEVSRDTKSGFTAVKKGKK